jgi:hypothetical protein
MDYSNFDEQGRFKPEYVDVYGIPFSVIPFRVCAGSGPSRCTSIPSRASIRADAPRAWKRLKRNSYRTGRSAAPTRLHPHSALPSLPPCRCVRVPCRRASLRRAFLHQIKHDGSGSSRGRMANG